MSHCKVQGLPAVSCAKMAEPIEMLFAMWTLVGPRKHVLDVLHISTNWRIRLKSPWAAVMQPYVKLL